MPGTMITLRTDGSMVLLPLDQPPSLELLKEGIGGGYLELIPGWSRFPLPAEQGGLQPCDAFCDEDGKRKQMPVNQDATAIWHAMLKLGGPLIPGWHDVLVGDVVIVTGDGAFMKLFQDGPEEELD